MLFLTFAVVGFWSKIQALLDQHTTKLTMSQSTYRSIEESAPPQDRLKYVHTYTWIHAYINTYKHTCMNSYTRKRTHIHTHTLIYTHKQTNIHGNTCTCFYLYTCTITCTFFCALSPNTISLIAEVLQSKFDSASDVFIFVFVFCPATSFFVLYYLFLSFSFFIFDFYFNSNFHIFLFITECIFTWLFLPF